MSASSWRLTPWVPSLWISGIHGNKIFIGRPYRGAYTSSWVQPIVSPEPRPFFTVGPSLPKIYPRSTSPSPQKRTLTSSFARIEMEGGLWSTNRTWCRHSNVSPPAVRGGKGSSAPWLGWHIRNILPEMTMEHTTIMAQARQKTKEPFALEVFDEVFMDAILEGLDHDQKIVRQALGTEVVKGRCGI